MMQTSISSSHSQLHLRYGLVASGGSSSGLTKGVCVCVHTLLLTMLVSKLNCLYLLQKKRKGEDGKRLGVGVKINLLDQKNI